MENTLYSESGRSGEWFPSTSVFSPGGDLPQSSWCPNSDESDRRLAIIAQITPMNKAMAFNRSGLKIKRFLYNTKYCSFDGFSLKMNTFLLVSDKSLWNSNHSPVEVFLDHFGNSSRHSSLLRCEVLVEVYTKLLFQKVYNELRPWDLLMVILYPRHLPLWWQLPIKVVLKKKKKKEWFYYKQGTLTTFI